MASQRLTLDIRERVGHKVLCHRYGADVEALVRDRAAFAEDVYNDVYRKADRERMAALPDGWLPTSSVATAKFGEHGSGYAQLDFDGGFNGPLLGFRAQAPKPHRHIAFRILAKHINGCWKAYAPDHKLSLRHQELYERKATLEQTVKQAERQIEAALQSVTTVAALVKAWPEMEPFVRPLISEPSQLPSIPVSKLNEMFKLPVAEAA